MPGKKLQRAREEKVARREQHAQEAVRRDISGTNLSDEKDDGDGFVNSSPPIFDYPDKTMIGIAMTLPVAWMLKEDGLNAIVSRTPIIIDIEIAAIFYSIYRVCKKHTIIIIQDKGTQETRVWVTEKEFEEKPIPVVFQGTTEIIPHENDENSINPTPLQVEDNPSKKEEEDEQWN